MFNISIIIYHILFVKKTVNKYIQNYVPMNTASNTSSKANQLVSLTLHLFKSKESLLLFRAFTTYDRPLVEYDCQVWSPCHLTLIIAMKLVQKFTKRHQSQKSWTY